MKAIIHSGTLPESRKRDLPLPKPLSLDAFSAQMAPHIFGNPVKASHVQTRSDMPFRAFTHSDTPSVDFMRLDEPSVDLIRPDEPPVDTTRLDKLCAAKWRLVPSTGGQGASGSQVTPSFPKPDGPDNTGVGCYCATITPFRRFQVMCSTRFKQIPLRT